MKILFFSPVHFERWDWRNLETGIGNSETAHIELAWRLAARGHEVISYAPIPDDCPGEWRGTFWKRLEEADFAQDGLWLLYRCPEVLDHFGPLRPEQPRWLICQDIQYPTWSEPRVEQADRVVALSPEHAKLMLSQMPYVRPRLALSKNGIRCDLIRRVEAAGVPERNPKKIIFASSPDRGLFRLLKAFSRAREYVPDLELHAFYGFDNIDKLVKRYPWMGREKKKILDLMRTVKGVTWRGRVSQTELYREMLTAGLWVYPTNFVETSCAQAMEQQALGAIPIVTPVGALIDHVTHGAWLPGNADDPLTLARFAGEIVRFATQPELQERIRRTMMPDARSRYNWSTVADQYEAWAGLSQGQYQFCFQIKHARGRILNVGCAGFNMDTHWRGDVVNVDAVPVDPGTQQPTRAHVLADIRQPLPECLGTFDSVVLGDVLEHFIEEADVVAALRHARAVLRPGGRVVLTIPDDQRSREAQIAAGPMDDGALQRADQYLEGIRAWHFRAIPIELVRRWLAEAGLTPVWTETLDYTHFEGHGIVAEAAP